MQFDPAVIRELAPTGVLRAALNLGNAVLAHSRTSTERPAGVTIDLARELGRRLGLAVTFSEFDKPGKALAAVSGEQADIGFLAVDPERAQGVSFTSPYVQIEGSYLVPEDSPIRRNEEVDAPGMRVVVGSSSAYELFLKRHLQHAELVRVDKSGLVVDAMLEQGHPVAAGVRQQLEKDAARVGGVRVLDGRFMVIEQAMVQPRSRSAAARELLSAFVQDMKRSGFVAAALARHGITGAKVAD